ncbi:MAG: chromate transporter [Paludibacter sp.]|nr:chromate transporter [Bacteroidales bacterium]MCM1068494.1 chromate transporter [Prevotella sp.]MCM1353448.1 chromate transporter [Bacteroides sp.]MCM1442609.1 chromate transporter [Muribaculum sp.]MCM1481454.1 chromate transporter [Paludibacter sp.]
MIYLQLFLSFFKIGLFGFGGGYAILSLIQHEIDRYGWMTSDEFVDMVAVSQMTPGPIGINSATYVGYTVTDSVLGSAVATFAIILPSLIIMLTLCRIYFRLKDNVYVATVLKGLRMVVIGLIAAAALSLMTPDNFIDYFSYLIFAATFIATLCFNLNPILLICLCGIAGYIIYN